LLKAASVSDVRATVSTLAAKSLLRVDGAGADAKIVAYHDRIREGVLHALEPAERTYCHAALARELLDEPGAKPQLIASHLHGAGEGRHAAQYALKAAEEAMRGLAYQAAADSYRDAIEWSRGELPDLHQVRRAQADACHRAGRCDEAGESYLRAALSAPSPRDKMELERLAAEAFLAAGAVKEAFVVLRPLFAEAGVPFPKDAAAAVRGLVVAIAKVRLRVRGKELPRREGVDEDALFKSALCWSVGKGLSNIAPVEGAVTVLRSLLYGLDSGSPEAAARGLLFIGSGFTPFMGRRPDDFMALAQAIADETASAVLQGLLHTAWCQRGLLVGDWDDAVRHGDDAVSILLAAPEPTAWGIAVARTTITACLEYRGHLREMRSRSEEFLRETANSGEQITFVMVTSALGYTLAAANDLVGLRRAIDDMRRTMASWTVEFGLWDFYRLRLEVLERLLGSEPASALELIDAAMPGIKAANLLRVPVVLPAILHVRVAAEMAALASAHPAQRAGLLKRARKSVAELERVSRPDGPALAKVVRASLLGLSGDQAGAAATLRSAHQACERAQLGAMSLMCQRLLSLRAGDSDTTREVEQRLAESGITNPELWGRYLTPGG
jgi:hypothetical protein